MSIPDENLGCLVYCSLPSMTPSVWNHFQYSIESDLVRVHPGRPAAHPTATGWDEELRARSLPDRRPRPRGPPYLESLPAF